MGQFDHHVTVTTRDEIADLALAFNRMIDRLGHSRHALEAYQQTLEEQVRQRTHELQQAMEEHISFEQTRLALLQLARSIAETERKLRAQPARSTAAG